MKKFLSILMVAFLVLSLGITMVPTQTANASKEHFKGITFTIKAAGEGSYEIDQYGNVEAEQGSGTFSIGFSGSGFQRTPAYRGRALAYRSAAGKVKGSFGTHEMDVSIHVWPMNDWYYCDYNRSTKELKLFGITVMGGFFDGKKVEQFSADFALLSPDSTSITINLVIKTADGIHPIHITIEEALADRFKIDIREVGY